MEQSWLVGAGRVGLYTYYIFVLTLIAGLIWQRVLPHRGARGVVPPGVSPPGSVVAFERPLKGRRSYDGRTPSATSRRIGLLRFTVEYLGNLDAEDESTIDLDRRRNHQARLLMAHIREDLARRGVTQDEHDHLIAKLRDSIRSVETGWAG